MDIISGSQVTAQVMDVVQEADHTLILVTPYFDPWSRLEKCIKNAHLARGVNTAVLLRGGKERKSQKESAKDLIDAGINVDFLERLHAKVYANENEAVVTSMNLLESSALDSWEISVSFHRSGSSDAYSTVLEECMSMLEQAKEDARRQKSTRSTSSGNNAGGLLSAVTGDDPSGDSGVCIRCSDPIDFDPERPFCKSCWRSWAQYENKDYEEDYCHACGESNETSFRKPLCYSCFKKQ